MRWVLITMAIMVGALATLTASDAWQGTRQGVVTRSEHTTITSPVRKVDLNVASNRELLQLPGFGPELAERVVRHRPYHKLDELVARKVLGRKEFARIKEQIRINTTEKKKN